MTVTVVVVVWRGHCVMAWWRGGVVLWCCVVLCWVCLQRQLTRQPPLALSVRTLTVSNQEG